MIYENKAAWPEKYPIDNLVARKEAIDKIIAGKKTAVRRNDRYADAGDQLELDGNTFIIENIYPQQLKTVTEENAKQEGYTGLEDYKKALTSIHKSVVWDPEQVVWVHELKRK